MGRQQHDVEGRAPLLYPSMQESLQLRLAFIRKVYSILTLQLLATVAFAALVASVKPVATFFKTTAGVAIYVVVLVLALLVMAPLYLYRKRHPLNFIFLGVFTLCFGFIIGLVSAFTTGKVVVEAVLATTVVVISLTVYTFWAARRGQDFSFLGPFLLSTLVILIMFSVFQIFYPMGKASEIIYSAICVIVFSGYIIYDTDTLIRRSSYDDYIWASVSLYLDIVNLFLQLLRLLRDLNKRS